MAIFQWTLTSIKFIYSYSIRLWFVYRNILQDEQAPAWEFDLRLLSHTHLIAWDGWCWLMYIDHVPLHLWVHSWMFGSILLAIIYIYTIYYYIAGRIRFGGVRFLLGRNRFGSVPRAVWKGLRCGDVVLRSRQNIIMYYIKRCCKSCILQHYILYRLYETKIMDVFVAICSHETSLVMACHSWRKSAQLENSGHCAAVAISVCRRCGQWGGVHQG